MTDLDSRRDRRITGWASLASVVSTMPAFLVGASGVLMRVDVDMTDAVFGAGVSLFFGTAALVSVYGGRIAEQAGAGRSLAFASGMSAAALLGMALMPPSTGWLLLALAVAGVGHGTAQPATNLVLTAASPTRRAAFRFGVKQAAIPVATLVAGLSIPVVASSLGWRWGFGFASVGAAVFTTWLFRRPLPAASPPPPPIGRSRLRVVSGPLVLLALAAGIGSSAATALASFLSQTATDAGFTVEGAGWLMAVGSVTGIAARIGVGWICPPDGYRALLVVASMLTAGAVGYAWLGTEVVGLVVVGTVFAFALGWGWTGLFHFAVVDLHPDAPGKASGIGQAGASAGAAAGPFIFGFVATLSDYRLAWSIAAGAALVAAVATVVALQWMNRSSVFQSRSTERKPT